MPPNSLCPIFCHTKFCFLINSPAAHCKAPVRYYTPMFLLLYFVACFWLEIYQRTVYFNWIISSFWKFLKLSIWLLPVFQPKFFIFFPLMSVRNHIEQLQKTTLITMFIYFSERCPQKLKASHYSLLWLTEMRTKFTTGSLKKGMTTTKTGRSGCPHIDFGN